MMTSATWQNTFLEATSWVFRAGWSNLFGWSK